jgi:hypothetical protein
VTRVDAAHTARGRACRRGYLQVGVVLVGQGHLGGLLHLLLVLREHGLVDLDLGRRKGGGGDEFLDLLVYCR